MLDGKAQNFADIAAHVAPESTLVPRLPNAAAWLSELSALEAEFETLLSRGTTATARAAQPRCQS
jgi:hypothetical protein